MEISTITKRDGSTVPFDDRKIFNALSEANYSCCKKIGKIELMDATDLDFLTAKVVKCAEEENVSSVEGIQDIVERMLIRYNYPVTAKEYILYRAERTKIRDSSDYLMQTFKDITFVKSTEIDGKRENANIDGDASMGVMLKYGSESSKYFIDKYVLPSHIEKAHREGWAHIHDKDFYMLTETCCQIDIKKLFARGFTTGHGFLRPPQSIESYAALACIVIQSNQNDMHGGQSIPNFDWGMEEGVKKTYAKEYRRAFDTYLELNNFSKEDIEYAWSMCFDENKRPEMSDRLKKILDDEHRRKLDLKGILRISINAFLYAKEKAAYYTDKRCYQAMESLVHNLNSMNSRAGSQVPFSSINYGTCTSPEGRMVIKNLLLATEAGLGNGETAIFPVQVFKIKDGINYKPEDPNYDLFKLSIRVSAKRLFPNWNSLDAPFNLQYYKEGDYNSEVATMGMVHDGFVKIKSPLESDNGYYISINRLGEHLVKQNLASDEIEFDQYTKYINVTGEVYISDCHDGTEQYVRLKKWMYCSDPSKKWYRLSARRLVTGENDFACVENWFTDDHPLPVIKNGDDTITPVRTCVRDIKEGDKIIGVDIANGKRSLFFTVKDNICVDPSECENWVGYDVETESDYFDIFTKIHHSSQKWAITRCGICSHNCRTRVMGNVYDPEREVTCGRGNLSFTTINLPRLGIEANHDIDKFFVEYDKMIDLVFEQLLHRFKIQSNKKVYNYPFLMGNGIWLDSEKLKWDDTVGEVLKHGTLTVGFCGLAECLVALIGKHHGESEEAQELGLRIVRHMRERCDQKSQEMKLNFTCIATPAESTAGRFLRLDREKYGIIPGVTDREYYTNSNHVPVYYPIAAFKKIDIEAPYHKYCNAGDICYIELDGDTSKNLEAVEQIVRYMHDKNVGYFSINHPVDRDPVCGYVGVIDEVCPRCGRREGEPISEEKLQELKRKYPNVPFHGCDCNH